MQRRVRDPLRGTQASRGRDLACDFRFMRGGRGDCGTGASVPGAGIFREAAVLHGALQVTASD